MANKEPQHQRKPMLDAAAQVASLRARGIAVAEGDEGFAAGYLTNGESLLHLSAYRRLFPKHASGRNKGKYINLGFRDLVYLSELDARLRALFLQLALDAERSAKMQILAAAAEREDEDGYAVVEDFRRSLPEYYRSRLDAAMKNRSDLGKKGYDVYVGQLIGKYGGDMPIWVLVEVVDFGTLLSLYRFCALRWDDTTMFSMHYVLRQVKGLRNACAHQNCILNGFLAGQRSRLRISGSILALINEIGPYRSGSRKKKLANARIQQIISLLYATRMQHPAKEKHAMAGEVQAIHDLLAECQANRVCANSSALRSHVDFVQDVIKHWFVLDRG